MSQSHEFRMMADTVPYPKEASGMRPSSSKKPATIVLAPPSALNTMMSILGRLRIMIRIARATATTSPTITAMNTC